MLDTAPASINLAADREMIPFGDLIPSPLNPRQHFDAEKIKGLADSIAASGVLQNLVVRPGIERPYEIVAGESRYRAIKLLVEQGRAGEGYLVPCLVRDIDDTEVLQLAMAENMSRLDLTPMEEARGLAALKERGVKTQEMAERLGCTQRHVQLRLKLVEGLAAAGQQALEGGKITVEMARVLAAAPVDKQEKLLGEVQKNPWQYRNADTLRRKVNEILIPESAAKFDIALYTGAWIEPEAHDFEAAWKAEWDEDAGLQEDYDGQIEKFFADRAADDEDEVARAKQRCFADVGQFMKLQKKAARELADKLIAKGAAWFEIKTGGSFREYDFETKKGNKNAGVVIFIDNHGALTVHEHLVKRPPRSADGFGGHASATPAAAKGPTIEQNFPRIVFEQAATAKYHLIQDAISGNPYHGLRLLCADILLQGHGTLQLDANTPESGLSDGLVAAIDSHLKKMPEVVHKGLKVRPDGFGVTGDDLKRLDGLFAATDAQVLKLAGLLIASLVGGQHWNLGSKSDDADIVAIADRLGLKGKEVQHGLALCVDHLEDLGDDAIRGVARDLKIDSWLLSTKADLLEQITAAIRTGKAKSYVLAPYRFDADREKALAALIKDTDGVTAPKPEAKAKPVAAPKKPAKKSAAKAKAKAKAAPKAKAKKKGGK